MRVTVTHGIADLYADMAAIPVKARKAFPAVVREGIKVGNTVAKDFARETSGTHAKLYPRTFSTEMNRGTGLFGNVYSGEYGPEPRGQGQLAGILENGSRNNPPHLNLARSADLIGPSFAQEALNAADRLFW